MIAYSDYKGITAMEITTANLDKVLHTPGLKSLCVELVAKRKEVENLRKIVDSLWLEFTGVPENRSYQLEENIFRRALIDIDRILKEEGIKPLSMDMERCPFLVAQNELNLIENKILDITAKPFNLNMDLLKNRQLWLAKILEGMKYQ